jgi:hypothetical protein
MTESVSNATFEMHLRALDARFSLAVEPRELAAHIQRLLEPLTSYPPGQCHYLITADTTEGGQPYGLYRDDDCVARAHTPGQLVPALISEVTRRAIECSGRYLLLHSAAAELDGQAVLLPAASGSGKTTLVDALVREGFRYLSDEMVAVDPNTLHAHPYPKPLTFDSADGAETIVAPTSPVSGPVPIGVVVSPTHCPGAGGRLTRLSRAAGVVLLAENAFNFHDHGHAGLRTLGGVASSAVTYRLTVDDLGQACDIVRQLIRTATGPRSAEVQDVRG